MSVEKIKKLLAKSRDAAASESEAEACMKKARELMDEYGISEDALREKAEGPGKEIYKPKYFDPWRRDLANNCASFYGCVAVFSADKKSCTVIGRESSRAVAIEMMDYLDSTVLRLARDYRKSVNGSRGEQLNFERACGTRIAIRLSMMWKSAAGEAPTEEGGGTSVVLMDELAQARKFLEEAIPNVRKIKMASSKQVGGAAAAGRAAGDKVSLGGQIGGSGGGVRLLG